MCFYFPCLDSFFKKKEDIVCDDDGSMSSMPSLYDLHFSARMSGVNIVPNKALHSFDTLVYTGDGGGDDVVVDLLSCDDYVVVNLPCDDDSDDDDDDDDGDEDGGLDEDEDGRLVEDEDGGLVWNTVRPPWNRYRAMLKREKERHLDMEFFDLYLKNRKKEEDRRTRILDSRDDFRDGDLYDPEDRDDNGF